MQQRYKLIIAYEGTAYCGWQRQKNGISIQQTIEDALHTVCREPVTLHASGRTDAGVHALAQVAHMDISAPIDPERLMFSLNALLPRDIRIQEIVPVDSDFHARYSATRKTYHYHVWLHRIADPFSRPYCYHIPYPIDLSLLREAAHTLVGTHDFTTFSHESHAGAAARNPVRTLYRLDLHPEGDELRLEFEGNGFLYKMVRNITGTLIDISRGKLAAGSMARLLAARDRRQGGHTAPPHGLFLVEVQYTSCPSIATQNAIFCRKSMS